MDRNFINFSKKELDKKIYRVFTIQRLLEIFQEKKLALVRPYKWDDPFENYIMNSTGELEDGQLFSIGFKDHFYGQCWTMTRESDALWRIYAPEKNGVRLTSTPRKLLSALFSFNQDRFKTLTCFIGKVEYHTTARLTQILLNANALMTDQSGIGQARSLLLKRKPFKHENEVRLIFNSLGKIKNDVYKFDINPFELFTDMVFDPRMDYLLFKVFKEHFRKLGFKHRIVKSVLYKIPKFSFDGTLKSL